MAGGKASSSKTFLLKKVYYKKDMTTPSQTAPQGLTAKEAGRRLKRYGRNVVVEKKRIGPVLILLGKLKNPLFILLIGISVVSFSVGQRMSGSIVLAMVFLSALLDFFNSYKSQRAVEKLASRIATTVTVLRSGRKQEIDFAEVVPGDVIFLSAGSIIPADCQILESDDFFVNQAALTGESLPVEKLAASGGGQADAAGQDRVFMGTSVVSGFATVLALQTGPRTEFGKIARDLEKAEPKTDFEISITKFSVFIMRVMFYMVSFVFVVLLIKILPIWIRISSSKLSLSPWPSPSASPPTCCQPSSPSA